MVEPSRDVATFLELAGRFGSLTGYGNDQSGVPLLVDLKPCCRKSLPTSFDSINPLRSAPFAAATPELPLPKEEKDHAGVPSPVIACMVRHAPLRIHAPHVVRVDRHAIGNSCGVVLLPNRIAQKATTPASELLSQPETFLLSYRCRYSELHLVASLS